MQSTELTDRQRAVLDYLVEFAIVRQKPPTIREIQEYFGYDSPNSAVSHLDALERKGFIRRSGDKSRNIELLDRRTSRSKPPPSVE
ncbi:hypothetical protein LCGC14_0719040 [marine sediment metagenome]|uniref:LexA repressor DNA-binding domain-containing protein n=1 Tax=marine sediment metagenome TaxID=412755 RepID=A0A0F9QH74_9ZZZZ